MAPKERLSLLFFALQLVLVHSTTTITSSPAKSSPATFNAGDDVNLTCSSTLSNPSYAWTTTLTNGDGSSVDKSSDKITAKYLHGSNIGTHMCTATSGSTSESASFDISVQGTSIWYYYPQPGGILQNNVAISVHSTVNEVRCYSPDASSSNDNSVITPPSDPPGLSFISSGAGKLVKTGGTSIDGMDTGVYTCSYSNGGVASSVNFAVYPREREPGDTNEVPLTIQTVDYAITGTSLTVMCTSSGWPATTVTWTKGDDTLSEDGTYSFSQSITDRSTSTYDNTLNVTATSQENLLGDYGCLVTTVRHNGETIDTTSGSVSVQSAGDLIMSVSSLEDPEIGETYELNCTVNIDVDTPTLKWKLDDTELTNTTGIAVGGTVNNGLTVTRSLTLGPLSQSHKGQYTCSAEDGSNTGSVGISVDVDVPLPTVTLSENNVVVDVGGVVSLVCSVTVPASLDGAISSITWTFGDTEVTEGVTTMLGQGMSTLALGKVYTAEAGLYTCAAVVMSQYINVDPSVSQSSTANITVLITTPGAPIISSNSFIYFSGTKRNFGCPFSVTAAVAEDTGISITNEFRIDNVAVVFDDRVSEGDLALIPGSSNYFGLLKYDYLTLSDSGSYSCTVMYQPKIENEFVRGGVLTGTPLVVDIQEPTPYVQLSTTEIRFPNHNDYNDQTITCTATLPLAQHVVDEIEFDKMFKWTQDSVDVTSFASEPTDPEEIESVSDLSVELTTAGEHVIQCRVSIQIPTDTEIVNTSTITVTVLGPASPNAPTDLTSFDIKYNEATIQWTVPMLSYTPEEYTVYYGTSESSLTDTSAMVEGAIDFSSANQQYSVTITDLLFNTLYYFKVRATNTEGNTESTGGTFKTKERPPTAPPENFTIEVINSTSLTISWDLPPADKRNGAITNYTLSCDETVGGEDMLITSIKFPLVVAENGSVSLTYDTFRPGTPVSCSVSASNFAGTGPAATATATTLEARPAGVPREFMIQDTTSRTFNVTWVSPDPLLQYGIITQYSLTCSETMVDRKPSSYPRTYSTAPSPSVVTIDDLRPSTEYMCSVIAINSAGSSDPTSDTSYTEDDAPNGTPNDFTITPVSSSSLRFNWRPIDKLLQNGEIMNYSLQCNASMVPLMEISPESSIEDSMGIYSQTVGGFRPGITYLCTISANTTIGAGPVAIATGTTLEERPNSAPTGITLTASTSTSVTISWQPPEIPNGIITEYTITITLVGCEGNVTYVQTITEGLKHEVVEMSPYQQLIVSMSASTAIGTGPSSTLLTIRSKPSVPEELKGVLYLRVTDSSVYTVSVPVKQDLSVAKGVLSQLYSSIVKYDGSGVRQSLRYDTGLGNASYCVDESDDRSVGSSYAFTFTQLTDQIPYNVTVFGANSAGNGSVGEKIVFTAEGIPPSPTNVTVERINDTAVTVRWIPISIVEAKGFIESYTINYYRVSSRKRQSGSVAVEPNVDNAVIGGLSRDSAYSFTVSASTEAGRGSSSDSYQVQPLADEGSTSLLVFIIPIVLVVLLILIVIVTVLLILFILNRKLNSSTLKSSGEEELEIGTYNSLYKSGDEIEKLEFNGVSGAAPHYDEVLPPTDPTAITLEERLKPIPKLVFSQHVKDMHKDRDRAFELEYQSLTNPTIIPHEAAEHPVNRAKNRFANIKPFDFSRVVLNTIEGVEGSDYINASYMDGYNKPNAYIAAQGPLITTVTDFWRMVWEHRLDTIVMLTKCREGGKRKCEEYWPDKVHEEKDYQYGITVTLTSITPYADFEKRVFRITKDNEPDSKPIEVTHWHFLGWPDHGVPQYATSLISFIRQVRKHRSKHGPAILTHCSAGVGRTGTFILLDSMLERLLVEDTINVYEFLRQMRSKRVFMVQTMQQYVFIHDALDELITCGDTDITVQGLKNKIDNLNKIIPGKCCTGFDSQFQLLGQVCRKPTESDCLDALTAVNKQKNRYPDRVPYDVCRTRLRPTGAPGADYVNASFVDGYKLKNAYIATQGPMINTVHDFWRMIWEFKSKAIVQLCQLEENGIEVCYQYWPAGIGEPMQFNKLIVTLQSENIKLGYHIRKFEIKEDRAQPTSFVVTQYQYTEWPEFACPTDYSNMLVLLEDLNKVQRSTGNKPITIVCNDGMGRTGTFISVHAQQDRMKTEGVIDVFHYIKSIRIQRPGLVANLDQFIFCHQTLTKFYLRFDSYSNFN